MISGRASALCALLVLATPVSFASDDIIPPKSNTFGVNGKADGSRIDAAPAERESAKQTEGGKVLRTERGTALEDEFGLPNVAFYARASVAANNVRTERWKQRVTELIMQESEQDRARVVYGARKPDDKYTQFGAAFAEARVPDCLHKDGLKRQPPRIAFFVFQGVLALPFVALAKARGKCI